jgi:hypothetical protein
MGKLYNLLNIKELSIYENLTKLIDSLSIDSKKKNIKFLSKIKKILLISVIKINDSTKIFIEKLNISLEAREVT